MWSRLWQLAFYLRCGASGMDSAFLKKAEIIRQRARKLNWQQTLARIITLEIIGIIGVGLEWFEFFLKAESENG